MPYKEIVDRCKEDHRCINCYAKHKKGYKFLRCDKCRRKAKEFNLRNKAQRQKYAAHYRKNKIQIIAEKEIREVSRVPLTNAERRASTKDLFKARYLRNKEKICAVSTRYYHKNKEKMRKKQKEYYEKNKEKIYEQHRLRYLDKKMCKEDEECQEKR